MKSILPWFVALIGIAGAIFFYKASDAKSASIASLQEQIADMETLRAENEALKKDQLPAEELARLTAAKDELPRLRNMVRQLTTDKSQLNQQARSAQQAAERAQSQAQTAQAQAEAFAQRAATTATNLPVTPEIAAALAARYGIDPTAAANTCINNLQQIDAAKQQWALENNKTADATPTEADLKIYIKGNTLPTCPVNGKYTIGKAGIYPTCSIAGHALAE